MINENELNEKVQVNYWHHNSIIEDALEAMKQGQLVPYFQPKYDYAVKQWCGAEALVRWIHPELGLFPLYSFIPLFEKNGQITKLDLYMLEQVCIFQKTWKEMQLPVLQVSVNFSQCDFAQQDFINRVTSILSRYDMTCNDIRFEITETSYVQCESTIKEFIRCVHERNFCVDMDDFGSGYSSLNMLDEACVDSIKLDMNMTRKAGTDIRCDHILRAVVQLAGELDIDVLAEGVETKVQADYLLKIGCKYMQGFYFSKPLPPNAYQQLLENMDKQQPTNLENEQLEEFNRPNGVYQAYERYKKYSKNIRSNSKTGHTGVSVTPGGKYRADITFNGKRYFLGKYDTLDEALHVRKQAERLKDDFEEEYYLNHPKAKRKENVAGI